MDIYRKLTLQMLLLKAVAYCLVGGLLFFATLWIGGSEMAMQQAFSIFILSSMLFALSVFGALVYADLMRRGGKYAMTYYLVSRVVRVLIALSLFLVYALTKQPNLLAFAINLLVLYSVGTVLSLVHFTRAECINKENNSQK